MATPTQTSWALPQPTNSSAAPPDTTTWRWIARCRAPFIRSRAPFLSGCYAEGGGVGVSVRVGALIWGERRAARSGEGGTRPRRGCGGGGGGAGGVGRRPTRSRLSPEKTPTRRSPPRHLLRHRLHSLLLSLHHRPLLLPLLRRRPPRRR